MTLFEALYLLLTLTLVVIAYLAYKNTKKISPSLAWNGLFQHAKLIFAGYLRMSNVFICRLRLKRKMPIESTRANQRKNKHRRDFDDCVCRWGFGVCIYALRSR